MKDATMSVFFASGNITSISLPRKTVAEMLRFARKCPDWDMAAELKTLPRTVYFSNVQGSGVELQWERK
jgi:hypothetical protein